jgi:hypothetical protein
MRRRAFEAEEGDSSLQAAKRHVSFQDCGADHVRKAQAFSNRLEVVTMEPPNEAERDFGRGRDSNANEEMHSVHATQCDDDERVGEVHASSQPPSQRDEQILFTQGAVGKSGLCGEKDHSVRQGMESCESASNRKWFCHSQEPVRRVRLECLHSGTGRSSLSSGDRRQSDRLERRERQACASLSCSSNTLRGFLTRGKWLLHLLVCLSLVSLSGGWISVSNEGYSVKHQLIAQAGIKVPKDFRVNGLLMVKPVATLQCNPSRRGALRWNTNMFEACDGETNWRSVSFCSRRCDINTDTVPCGLPVRNRCDVSCSQTGTGLNMRQCLLAVSTTLCHTPVVDSCGNECGLVGMMNCRQAVRDVGELVIQTLEGVPGTAQFSLTVGKVHSDADLAGKLAVFSCFL